jgi:dienelactone hydrolase
MPNFVRTPIDYSFGDVVMSGELVVDASIAGPRPGVLVVHEAFGLGEHAIANAERLAGLGYAALAMDLWGSRAQITEMPKVMDAIGAMIADRATWMGRVGAALDTLADQPEVDAAKLAAIGYCFGGASVLEFARTGGGVLGVGSFHGALNPLGADWSSERTKGKLLICTGSDDPLVPAAAIAAFQENIAGSGVDWELNLYSGTKHSFTNPAFQGAAANEMIEYNAQSDRRSRERLDAFLAEIFA